MALGDALLALLVSDPLWLARLQTLKGWLYVLLTAALAWWLLLRAQRAEVKRTTDIFRGQIVDVTSSVYTVQLAGTSDKLDSFIQAIGTASILETVRSGVTGIARGDKVLSI